jgi:hypothetical protein
MAGPNSGGTIEEDGREEHTYSYIGRSSARSSHAKD